jgi:hypothetical protein
MSLSHDLDAWAADLETATGLRVTRDPDAVFPPCLYVEPPEITAATMPSLNCEVSVYVIGEGTGKARTDAQLDMLPAVLEATGTRVATLTPITVGGQDFTPYRLTVPIRIVI